MLNRKPSYTAAERGRTQQTTQCSQSINSRSRSPLARKRTHTYTHAHIFTHARTRTHTQTSKHANTQTHTHTHTHTNTNTNTNTSTHINTHTNSRAHAQRTTTTTATTPRTSSCAIHLYGNGNAHAHNFWTGAAAQGQSHRIYTYRQTPPPENAFARFGGWGDRRACDAVAAMVLMVWLACVRATGNRGVACLIHGLCRIVSLATGSVALAFSVARRARACVRAQL